MSSTKSEQRQLLPIHSTRWRPRRCLHHSAPTDVARGQGQEVLSLSGIQRRELWALSLTLHLAGCAIMSKIAGSGVCLIVIKRLKERQQRPFPPYRVALETKQESTLKPSSKMGTEQVAKGPFASARPQKAQSREVSLLPCTGSLWFPISKS